MDILAVRRTSRPLRGAVAGQLSLLAAATLFAMGASAQTAEGDGERRTNVGFTLGAGYSDNLLQSGFETQDGTYTALGMVLDIDRESRRFRALVSSDLEYRDYSRDEITDEPWGQFDAEIELRAVPERFSWMVVNNYNEGRTNPFLALGPGNREQINVFETGPAVYLPLGEQTEFRISGMAGQRSFDDSQELDSDTTTASAGIYRDVNSTTELGLTFTAREVEYDRQLANNQIDIAYFSYIKRFSSGGANVRVGATEVSFSSRVDDAPYVDISWNRDVGRRSNLSLGLTNQYVDAGDSFRGNADTADAVLTFDVYEQTGINAGLTIEGNRSELSFSTRMSEDRYQTTSVYDNDSLTFNVAYDRELSALMAFSAQLDVTDRDFITTPQQYADKRAIFGIERYFSRKLAIRGEFQHIARGSANALNFDENQLSLHVRYDLNPSASDFDNL